MICRPRGLEPMDDGFCTSSSDLTSRLVAIAERAHITAFEAPAVVFRSNQQPGITMCAYASCHSSTSTTRLTSGA